MSTQLLFYEQVVPVTVERHGGLSVRTGTDYSFARKANSVPLTTAEIPLAAAEYCIVFAGKPDDPSPVALLGAKKDENLYVDASGAWTANYIPAFVRRYPFIISRNPDGKTLTLCVDETFSGCNRQGRGERLFDSDGAQTAYLKQVLAFQQTYQEQNHRTQAFCKKLVELNLLEPIKAQIRTAAGERRVLTGVSIVSRTKLKALTASKLTELVESDQLELIYLHLHSLTNLRVIGERIATPIAETTPDGKNRPQSGTIH